MKKYAVSTIMIGLGAMIAGEAAHAQTAAAPLAPGEILLQVSASGKTSTRADLITITVPVTTSAATSDAARASNRAAISKLKAALISAGIPSQSILSVSRHQPGFVGNEAFEAVADATGADSSASVERPAPPRYARSFVEIRLSDAGQRDAVEKILDDLNLTMIGAPSVSLTNDGAAREVAVAAATANARREAERYATSLNLRIVRITRVANECSANPMSYMENVMRMATGRSGSAPDMVVTEVTACIDFVAAPK